MIERFGADAGQLTFAVLDGGAPPRSRSKERGAPNGRGKDTCNDCGEPVRRIVAGDVCGWPAVVSQHPVDRPAALAAIVAGRPVYVHLRHKHDTAWWALDRDTIGSPHLATGDHHLAHVCSNDPDPPPPKPAANPDTFPQQPPF